MFIFCVIIPNERDIDFFCQLFSENNCQKQDEIQNKLFMEKIQKIVKTFFKIQEIRKILLKFLLIIFFYYCYFRLSDNSKRFSLRKKNAKDIPDKQELSIQKPDILGIQESDTSDEEDW